MAKEITVVLGGAPCAARRLTFGELLDVGKVEKSSGVSTLELLAAYGDSLTAATGSGEAVRAATVPEIRQAFRDLCVFTLSDLEDTPSGETPSP
jgi:hypothetical protein